MYAKENPADGGTPDGAKAKVVAIQYQNEKQNQQLTFDLEQALLDADPAAHDVGGDHAA
jgi:hypothetical protein